MCQAAILRGDSRKPNVGQIISRDIVAVTL